MNNKTVGKRKVNIGTKDIIDLKTGQRETVNRISIEDCDINFDKVWIAAVLDAIEEISTQKIRVFKYLIKNRNSENTVLKNIQEIARDLDISWNTVKNTLKVLSNHGIITYKVNVIKLSPNVIFRGSHDDRMSVLIEYKKFEEDIKNKDKEISSPQQSTVEQLTVH